MVGLIHVGAWEGLEYIGDTRRLLLFEPQARAFEVLRRNLAASPKALLVNAAAGAEPGELTLYRVEPDHSSSLLRPQRLRTGFDFAGEETVKVTTVDATVKEFGLSGLFDALVVDTQGYELEVLRGACETLKDVVRVGCELHDVATYPGAASLEQVDAFLGPLGFDRTQSDTNGDVTYERRADAHS